LTAEEHIPWRSSSARLVKAAWDGRQAGLRFATCAPDAAFCGWGRARWAGLSLGDVLQLRAESDRSGSLGRKSIIMIFLSGGPSHLDMYDMKPEAPSQYRGEFKPIATNVPGMPIC
jgi:hypothetical protein